MKRSREGHRPTQYIGKPNGDFKPNSLSIAAQDAVAEILRNSRTLRRFMQMAGELIDDVLCVGSPDYLFAARAQIIALTTMLDLTVNDAAIATAQADGILALRQRVRDQEFFLIGVTTLEAILRSVYEHSRAAHYPNAHIVLAYATATAAHHGELRESMLRLKKASEQIIKLTTEENAAMLNVLLKDLSDDFPLPPDKEAYYLKDFVFYLGVSHYTAMHWSWKFWEAEYKKQGMPPRIAQRRVKEQGFPKVFNRDQAERFYELLKETNEGKRGFPNRAKSRGNQEVRTKEEVITTMINNLKEP